MRLLERAIETFAEWFESSAAVWQTFVFCMLLAGAEAIWPRIDPSNLHYLYALTVYSAVTQPALAYSARRAAAAARQILTALRELVEGIAALMRNQGDLIEAVRAQSQVTAMAVTEMATAVQELRATTREMKRMLSDVKEDLADMQQEE